LNVITIVAVLLLPPQVAFTVYVPAIQLEVPPATVTWLYAPVEGFTGSSPMSTTTLAGFFIVTTTAVFAPGLGVTVPLIMMDCDAK